LEDTRHAQRRRHKLIDMIVIAIAAAVRGHWGIENDLHWSLDVAFRDDDARVRELVARENLAVLRHIALSRLKRNTKTKLGIKNKRLRAGWDERYLEELPFEAFPPTEEPRSSEGQNISEV
jgi:hypothetical protein